MTRVDLIGLVQTLKESVADLHRQFPDKQDEVIALEDKIACLSLAVIVQDLAGEDRDYQDAMNAVEKATRMIGEKQNEITRYASIVSVVATAITVIGALVKKAI